MSSTFWSTQPVTQTLEQLRNIETSLSIKQDSFDININPLKLPEDYFWYELDVENTQDINGLYKLLQCNYVEDTSNTLRFNYSKGFLKWSLTPPNYKKEFILAVKYNKGSKPLVAFISAIPITVVLSSVSYSAVEINFLCVHKNLRNLRLTPVLIREITRRVNLSGIQYALYTTGIKQSLPITSCTYYHRPLNTKKLIEANFLDLKPKFSMAQTIKYNKLPQMLNNINLRPLKNDDCESAHILLNNYLQKFKLHMHFSLDEFKHWFLNNETNVICYVLENDNKITDMCSFYILPTTLLDNMKHDSINVVYSWYNVATSIPLKSLMKDALVIAHNKGFDVYNCLDIHDNKLIFNDLKFVKGNGDLNYYMFNMFVKPMLPEDIGLVMV